tara:strand:- start:104 stop:307 length:204 start_codon:yes stop_codon:yes gene_type:complete
MYIDDEYLEHLFVSNPTHLNSNTATKTSLLSTKNGNKKYGKITLIQQLYLTMLTLIALKVLSSSMYK